ncbi:MAG: hypothetical protein R3A13_10420 [Bdellovibrionota bacterium]
MTGRSLNNSPRLGSQPEAVGVADPQPHLPKRGSRVTPEAIIATILLTACSSIGAPQSATDSLRKLSPAAAAALENMGPRQALAEPEEASSAIQVNISPEELQKEVDKAISRGTTWLKKEAKKLISENKEEMRFEFPATAALLAAALAKGGVSPKDRTFKKLIEIADTHLALNDKNHNFTTYGVSLLILALEYAYLPKNRTQEDPRIPVHIQHSISRYTRWLIDTLDSRGGSGYPSNFEASVPDISNTQFVANAFSAALAFGEKIPSKVFKHLADYALTLQVDTGPEVTLLSQNSEVLTGEQQVEKKVKSLAFVYRHGARGTLASTSAGIYILACALEGLQINAELAKSQTSSSSETEILDPEYRKKLEDAIYSGLAWLQENYSGCLCHQGFRYASFAGL